MLRGQMSPWQLESFLNVSRNLPLKFGQNQVSSSWDIGDIEFVVVGGGGGGGGVQSHFRVKPNLGYVRLNWGWVGVLTKKKITVEIVATNVVASRPPNGDRLQRRPLVPIVFVIGMSSGIAVGVL